MVNSYVEYIFTKLGSGIFLIYVTISAYFLRKGEAEQAKLWIQLSEAYITYNAASYLLTNEKALSLPKVQQKFKNFINWFLNNFFSRKVFVLILAMVLITCKMIAIEDLFAIGIFMLGGRMVEKFSRGVQRKMEVDQIVTKTKIRVDQEEGEA